MTEYEQEIIDLHDAALAAAAAAVYGVAADFLALMDLSHVCAGCCYAAHDQYYRLGVSENRLPVNVCSACTPTSSIRLPNGQVVVLRDWTDDQKLYDTYGMPRKVT